MPDVVTISNNECGKAKGREENKRQFTFLKI